MEHTPRTITEIRLKSPTRPKSPPRVADVIADELVNAGVDTLFMLPGGTISPVLDACLDKPQIRQVGTRHESGAMFAAAGYARATDKLGVVCVTSGPGVLNTLTGLASAHCEGIPMLVLAGEIPRAKQGQMALQDGSAHHLDILTMVKPVAKLALEITRPEAAPAILRRAVRTAMSGKRGPVVLTVPMDVARCIVPEQRFFSEVALDYAIEGGMMGRALDEAAAALAAAVRPAILAGSGVRHGLGPERLQHLAERLQVPVLTTPKAKGLFPESHPLSLGVFGHGGHPSSREYLERGIDVLLAVGTSMSDTGTDGQSDLLRPTESLIHVDVDALQLGRHYPVTLGIVGEADDILRAMARRVAHVADTRRFGVRRHGDPEVEAYGPSGMITPQRALWELQQVLPADTLYTCDIGEHLLFATHYLTIDPPGGFMAMNGLASMGSGLGAAIGAQLGSPERTVAAICGDGTFAMHGAEVATASAEGLPIVFVVLDDRRFGMVENGHEALYGRTPPFSTEPVNVRALAEALGAHTTVIRKPGDILNANLRSTHRPMVLDVQIDAAVRMPKNGRFEELKRAAQE